MCALQYQYHALHTNLLPLDKHRKAVEIDNVYCIKSYGCGNNRSYATSSTLNHYLPSLLTFADA
uniref:Putative ovule protein n=1 Tax=Solanum chacoense TaxID=4108 RepID=A0A0V0I1L8_SOLCH